MSRRNLSQRVPPLRQNFSDTISNLLTVPEDQASLQGAKSVASALVPSPNADFSTLVYASNRNAGLNGDPRGGVIAVFILDAVDGKLLIISQFFTGLKQVRGMQPGGPNSKFLHFRQDVGGGLVKGEDLWNRSGDD